MSCKVKPIKSVEKRGQGGMSKLIQYQAQSRSSFLFLSNLFPVCCHWTHSCAKGFLKLSLYFLSQTFGDLFEVFCHFEFSQMVANFHIGNLERHFNSIIFTLEGSSLEMKSCRSTTAITYSASNLCIEIL